MQFPPDPHPTPPPNHSDEKRTVNPTTKKTKCMTYSGSKNKHPNNKSQPKAWLPSLSPPFLNTDAERNKRKKLDPIPQN
jgi:hypothetical protein